MGLPQSEAAYDGVGRYRQDEVNGFSKELIFQMFSAARLENASRVLDAMAGDGNLTSRLSEYCLEKGLAFPATTVLEYSRVQVGFAEASLAGLGAEVVWGDALGMKNLATGEPLPDSAFDRVLIKSANHEIPLALQPRLYDSIFRVLRPGGTFVNLGMLFDDARERDELREIARVKDTYAGMTSAALNRYFLTRAELYSFLSAAGFVEARGAHALEYAIRSQVVAEQYFRPEVRETTDLEFQAAQVKAITLRRNGRLRFDGVTSLMKCPGEITIARRPTLAHVNRAIYNRHPLDFLRHVRAHAELLDEAARHLPRKGRLLEAGCGIGLLTEYLPGQDLRYLGLDASSECVALCTERYGNRPECSFQVGQLHSALLEQEAYDAVALLHTLHLSGANAVGTLRKAHDALRKGGRLVVAALSHGGAYVQAEPALLAQLEREGLPLGRESRVQALRAAHAPLVSGQGNYWSLEGIVALLGHVGFDAVVATCKELYFGSAYLVVAAK